MLTLEIRQQGIGFSSRDDILAGVFILGFYKKFHHPEAWPSQTTRGNHIDIRRSIQLRPLAPLYILYYVFPYAVIDAVVSLNLA